MRLCDLLLLDVATFKGSLCGVCREVVIVVCRDVHGDAERWRARPGTAPWLVIGAYLTVND